MSNEWAAKLKPEDLVLDAIPDTIEETMRARAEWMKGLPKSSDGLEFVVSDLSRWNPGQQVRVAFKDGDAALHRDIAEATEEITRGCNLVLDFWTDRQAGTFRTWSPQDTEYAGEIRVSFDLQGFFSLVGTDSVNPAIGAGGGPIGGNPGQCSLNLGGFTSNRPPNWRGVVRHEFLHALSFHHAHQNLRGPCEQSFRWDDDEGYQPTQDPRGAFVADSAGRRPGIYTFLSGFPNFWNRAKVDHNLRTEESPELVVGPFDAQSVMLYRFPPLFYKSTPSPCAPSGEGLSLSTGDLRGLQLLYPGEPPAVAAVASRRAALLETVEKRADADLEGLEGGRTAEFARAAVRMLRRSLAAAPQR
jgi:hypothetical protein